MIRSQLLWIVAAVVMPTAAFAMTGAELVQVNREFGIGYVWGAIDASVDVPYGTSTIPLFQHRSNCLVKAKISSGTTYESVVAVIKNDPSLLGEPAVLGVSKFLFEMCGAVPK